jgi:hypothetical protein
MRKIVLTFGLIAGVMMSAMMLITMPFHDQIGFDKGIIVGYTSMVLAFLMVFFGVKAYRDNVAGESISFGRAFKVGLLITLVASSCYVATWMLLGDRIAPGYMDKYTAHVIEKLRNEGATEAEIAAETREMAEFQRMYQNPLIKIAFTLIEPLPVGLVFTLVTAGVMSRRRRPAAVPALEG